MDEQACAGRGGCHVTFSNPREELPARRARRRPLGDATHFFKTLVISIEETETGNSRSTVEPPSHFNVTLFVTAESKAFKRTSHPGNPGTTCTQSDSQGATLPSQNGPYGVTS